MTSNTLKSGDYSQSLNLTVFNEIKPKSTVLDIGCWTGNLGVALIEEKKCVVDGMDISSEGLKKAKSRGYRNTYLVNLNAEKIKIDSVVEKYDYILFADVLEHLINPELVLELVRPLLRPKGRIIVSLPNVAFGLNRFNLLLGRWNYTEFGTLDKTHLKFFTITTGKNLLLRVGYKLIKVTPYNQFGFLRHLNFLNKICPGFFSYQFMLVASKD
ncbi:MAG: class I SAM-dependent methyltransferase [Patescibacteria group bacterium]